MTFTQPNDSAVAETRPEYLSAEWVYATWGGDFRGVDGSQAGHVCPTCHKLTFCFTDSGQGYCSMGCLAPSGKPMWTGLECMLVVHAPLTVERATALMTAQARADVQVELTDCPDILRVRDTDVESQEHLPPFKARILDIEGPIPKLGGGFVLYFTIEPNDRPGHNEKIILTFSTGQDPQSARLWRNFRKIGFSGHTWQDLPQWAADQDFTALEVICRRWTGKHRSGCDFVELVSK